MGDTWRQAEKRNSTARAMCIHRVDSQESPMAVSTGERFEAGRSNPMKAKATSLVVRAGFFRT